MTKNKIDRMMAELSETFIYLILAQNYEIVNANEYRISIKIHGYIFEFWMCSGAEFCKQSNLGFEAGIDTHNTCLLANAPFDEIYNTLVGDWKKYLILKSM